MISACVKDCRILRLVINISLLNQTNAIIILASMLSGNDEFFINIIEDTINNCGEIRNLITEWFVNNKHKYHSGKQYKNPDIFVHDVINYVTENLRHIDNKLSFLKRYLGDYYYNVYYREHKNLIMIHNDEYRHMIIRLLHLDHDSDCEVKRFVNDEEYAVINKCPVNCVNYLTKKKSCDSIKPFSIHDELERLELKLKNLIKKS